MPLPMTGDEQTLLDGLRAGEDGAYRTLLDMHYRAVYRTALAFVRSAQDAEDIAQETFITAFRSIGAFKADAALATWLHRITVTRSLDHLRRARRRKRSAVLVGLFGPGGALTVDPASPLHPGVLIEDAERARVLFAAVDRLPERQRVAYTLHAVEHMSMGAAADVMGLTSKAVESLLSRARENLRRLLRRYYDDEG